MDKNDIRRLIEQKLTQSKHAIPEDDAKKIFNAYQVPVVPALTAAMLRPIKKKLNESKE